MKSLLLKGNGCKEHFEIISIHLMNPTNNNLFLSESIIRMYVSFVAVPFRATDKFFVANATVFLDALVHSLYVNMKVTIQTK